VAVPIPDRCVEPGCGVPIVPWGRGMRVSDLPAGYRFHGGHGLCRTSYLRARRRGEVHRYERITRSARDVLEVWQALRRPQFDYSVAQVAQVLKMSPRALEDALHRARDRGDPRAVPARDTRFKPAPRRRSPQPDIGPGFDPCTRDEGEEAS
jgi:hypothetical protein